MNCKLFIDTIKILNFERIGRNNFACLSDGRKLNSGKLEKLQIECETCNRLQTVRYRASLLNKKYTCQSCGKKGDKNPFYGKRHSSENKLQHSEFMKGRYVGELNPFYGKTHSEETKKIIGQKSARSGEDNGFYGKTHSAEFKKKHSVFMKTIGKRSREYYSTMGIKSVNSRPKKTKIERKTEDKLLELGIKFKYNFILKGKAQYDFLINDKILLEVHGDFWHGNPIKYKNLTARQEYKKQRDAEKKKLAEENGYRYIVIWESEIEANDWSILNEV